MHGVLACAAALLLAVAGLAKARTPAPAAAMLARSLPALRRVRGLQPAVRVAGAAEVAVAVAAITAGGRVPMLLLALAYAALAVLAVRMRSRGAGASCGCFGAAPSPIGPAHVVVDLVAVAAAVAGVLDPPGPVAGLAHDGALVAVTALAQAVVLAGLAYLSITSLPAMLAARRRLESR